MQGAIFGYPAIAIGYGALVLAALSPSSFLYRPGRTKSGLLHYVSAFTRLIATLSYSIYLTHKQLIHLTHEALRPYGLKDDSYIVFWISVVIAFLGGWLLHVAVEKPFMRLRDRLIAKRRLLENNIPTALNSR
jgi:peptidoglycan/LPS O-acetylase OafA/YrhL